MNVLHIMSQVLVIVLITVTGVFPGMPTGGLAAVASAAEQTMNMSSRKKGFADVIEVVRPAVVNISVKRHPRSNKFERFPRTPERYGYPTKPFFRRFFERQNWRTDFDATEQSQASGSGFIIDPTGIVLTNHHVVDGAAEIVVTLDDGTELMGNLLGTDAKTDLALLTVEGKSSLPYVSFGNSDAMRAGDWVLAIGNPFGLGGTATLGIISARGRDIQSGPFDDFLQIDAPINRGNSGGPLFDETGNVIGVNTAIFSPNGGNVGIGFAIPSEQARPVIEQLRAQGYVDRGWLGVQIQSLDEDISIGLGLKDVVGALVTNVVVKSPAGVAGIKSGDVVTAFDGRPIENIRDLTLAVAAAGSEEEVELDVRRGVEVKTLTVRLGVNPENEALSGRRKEIDEGSDDTLGLSLALLPSEVRRRFHIENTMTGVLVVGARSVPSGLSRGDVILKVGTEPVSKPSDVVELVATAREKGQSAVVFYVARSLDRRFIAVSLT